MNELSVSLMMLLENTKFMYHVLDHNYVASTLGRREREREKIAQVNGLHR
jgi:hypothetical protein